MDGWRELPSYTHPFLNCQMAVHSGKAYLFRGLAAVDYFDLEHERWGRVSTHFLNARGGRAEWPYKETLADYGVCVVAARGTLYVFGGQYTRAIGCNLFAALDIARRTWTLLSGTPDSVPLLPQYDVPGPRKQHAMWADGAGERVYVMYGMADRQAADLYQEEFGSAEGFVYDDCWSWDVAKKQWRRERVAGNMPCPRAEMSTCYVSRLVPCSPVPFRRLIGVVEPGHQLDDHVRRVQPRASVLRVVWDVLRVPLLLGYVHSRPFLPFPAVAACHHPELPDLSRPRPAGR